MKWLNPSELLITLYLTWFLLTILFYGVFFLIINWWFLIAVVTTQICIPTAEVEISAGIQIKEEKAEMKIKKIEVKIQCNLKSYKPLGASYLSINFVLFF